MYYRFTCELRAGGLPSPYHTILSDKEWFMTFLSAGIANVTLDESWAQQGNELDRLNKVTLV
jgi:hypothetical protein